MSSAPTVVLALVAVVLSADSVGAQCDPATEPDRTDVANARAAVAQHCDCAAASTHGAYVRCAAEQAQLTLTNPACARYVKRCAARSICGKPGFVTCCRITAAGKTNCRPKRDATRCVAPRGGTACVGQFTSCCDACTASGCAPPLTPTPSATATATPTSTPPLDCSAAGPFAPCGSCGSGVCLTTCSSGCSSVECVETTGGSCTDDSACAPGAFCVGIGCVSTPMGPYCGFSPSSPGTCAVPCP